MFPGQYDWLRRGKADIVLVSINDLQFYFKKLPASIVRWDLTEKYLPQASWTKKYSR